MTDLLLPARIQLRRTKGWRKPDDAIVVARPTIYGNPYRVIRRPGSPAWGVWFGWRKCGLFATKDEAIGAAVDMYQPWVVENLDGEYLVERLAGHPLACWCPLPQPCHADVLLHLANTGPQGG